MARGCIVVAGYNIIPCLFYRRESMYYNGDKIIEKGEWDKKVAEKIRQIDTDMKGLYGQTNQGISGAIR